MSMLKDELAHESRRARAKQRKLDRIEKAARRLFAARGFDETTTRAIAKDADIGVGTLFVYFPEKLDILLHLYRKDLEATTTQALDALPPELPLVEALSRVFDAAFAFYDGDQALARSFIKELMFLGPERQPEMLQLTMRFLDRIGDLVARAQIRGEARSDVGRPLVAHQIFGLYYWCLVNWLGGRFMDRAQASTLLRMQLELAVRGPSPASGS